MRWITSTDLLYNIVHLVHSILYTYQLVKRVDLLNVLIIKRGVAGEEPRD